MKELEIFENENFGSVGVVMREEQPWFVAKDVCSCLGLEPRDSVRYLDNDEKSNVLSKHIGQNGGKDPIIINESGLYSLILRSRKPEAKKFKKWVTSEVLPSIRKHGGYLNPNVDFSDPNNLRKILDNWAKDREEKIKLQTKVVRDAPKVKFADVAMQSSAWIDMQQVAAVLGIASMGRTNLFKFLRENKILLRNNIPYRTYIDNGYFKIVESFYEDPYTGVPRLNIKPVVSQKGLNFIRELLSEDGYGVV